MIDIASASSDPACRVVVAGAGGFIGGHLVQSLLKAGLGPVVGIDVKPFCDWHQAHEDAENLQADLSSLDVCMAALPGARHVYNLAADMGGMGFIEKNKARCMLSVLISTHLLVAARHHSAERFFFASSACVYAAERQSSAAVQPLRESDAYPAMPEDGYGWEKLFSERLCRHFEEDFGLETRVARFHNIYGPLGTWIGGREKAPAAICRKVAEAKLSGNHEIEIWGDGKQTRSFTFIDDCIGGIQAIMQGPVNAPLNVGSDELVTIDRLVDLVEGIAGIRVKRNYVLDAPQGVRGRNSDNSRIYAELGWSPTTGLQEGLERTYAWIYDQVRGSGSQLPADA